MSSISFSPSLIFKFRASTEPSSLWNTVSNSVVDVVGAGHHSESFESSLDRFSSAPSKNAAAKVEDPDVRLKLRVS